MPPIGDHQTPTGQSRLPGVNKSAGRSMSVQIRDLLQAEPGWRTFTTDQRRWVCSWCLAAVARRPQRSWEDSIAAHMETCRHYGGGRFQSQPPAAVAAQLSYENMVSTAEAEPTWGVYDNQGIWVCPACLDKIIDVRLVNGQRTQLTYRAMALHFQRCQHYGAGVTNAAPVVRAARDRPIRTPQQRLSTLSIGTPVITSVRTPTAAPILAAPIAQIATPTKSSISASETPRAKPAVGSGLHMRMRRGVSQPTESGESVSVPSSSPIAKSDTGTPAHTPIEAVPAVPHVPTLGWMDQADNDAESGPISSQSHLENTDLMRAGDLQLNLLGVAPTLPGYTFATRYEPCGHVSGDFFSFIQLLDGRIAFAIGDVSGHGMQAGLVMSMAKKTLEIYGELIPDPAEVLAKVNDALAGDLGGKMFVSMTYAVLTPADRRISWVRAGHNPTICFNHHTGEGSEIKPPGMVVGMKGGQIFRDSLQIESTQLRTGDTFLLYTDGITEATNAQGEEFEVARLSEIVAKYSIEGPEALLTQITDRLRHFRGTSPINDDVTMLALAVE